MFRLVLFRFVSFCFVLFHEVFFHDVFFWGVQVGKSLDTQCNNFCKDILYKSLIVLLLDGKGRPKDCAM